MTSGFWYDNSRPPQTDYETIPYANLAVRIRRPYQEGPGQDLIIDPFDWDSLMFTGNTIARQTFDTQFILDMQFALGIDVNRIFVIDVQKGDVHFSWESTSVVVKFAILERNQTGLNTLAGQTLLETIASLTNFIQIPESLVYHGTNVTRYVDPLYGVEVSGWDMSLQLSYAIEIIGESAVVDGYYLNLGSKGTCDVIGANNFTAYCEFERFFEDDVSSALNISDYRVQVQFIKKSSFDQVLVHFRISPARDPLESNIAASVLKLNQLMENPDSQLYLGNVTIRTDTLWGVREYV